MSDVLEIYLSSGERIERELTDLEREQRAADEATANAEVDALAAKEAAKASAIAKLQALGLTTEEAQAIAGI